MRVRYFDPYVDMGHVGVDRVATLEELVSVSDIVTVHVPHEPETENLFNGPIFNCFQNGSYFVNTSRGELVDHGALLHALQSGKLAGAALDVIEGEFGPDFQDHVLEQPLIQYARTHSNLIITPHIGGSTTDAWGLTQEFTIRKVIESIRSRE
jgi:D-3-phosphoglycerate dehydrogenase